jgi:clan AA aspartic protease
MITGRTNAVGEPIVRLRIKGADGRLLECDAIVDTGFTGLVALPREILSNLQLPRVGTVHVQYGDADVAALALYRAVIEWDGVERSVEVDCFGSNVLLGTALLAGHELRITFVINGTVEIARLP